MTTFDVTDNINLLRANVISLDEIAVEAFKQAQKSGFYDHCPKYYDTGEPIFTDSLWLTSRIAFIHSELSEALESIRDKDIELRFNEEGKPEGLVSELADAIIRIADLSHSLGISLNKAVYEKMKYNATRPYKHGRPNTTG